MMRLARESGALAVAIAIGSIGPLLVMIYVTRTSTLAAYGAYAAVQALVALLEIALVSRAGEIAFQVVAPAWLEKRDADVRAAIAAITRQEVLINGGVYVVLVAGAWTVGRALGIDPLFATILGLSLPLQIGYGTGKCLMVAAGATTALARNDVASYLVLFTAQAGLYAALGLPGLAVGTLVGIAFRTVAMRSAARPYQPAAGPEVPEPTPLIGAIGHQATVRNLLVGAAGNVDTVLAGALAGPEAAATYKVARSLSSMAPRAASPVWGALRPRQLAAWNAKDLPRLRRLTLWPGLGLAALFVPLWVAAALVAPAVIGGIFGEGYRASAAPFLWLFVGTWAFGAVTGWFHFYAAYTGSRHAGITINATLVGALAVGVVAYGHRSAEALAIAVAGALAFAACLCWALFWRHTRPKAGAHDMLD